MRQFFRKRIWKFSVAVLIVAGCVLIVGVTWLNRQLSTAREFVSERQWKNARQILTRYLEFRPRDAEARMLLVRCLFSDNSLPIKTVADEVLACLAAIPKSAPESAAARAIEGRAYFLLLLQPDHAEKCFKSSLEQDPNRTEARVLLWKLYDLTGRWHLSSEHFWKIYDRWEPRDRARLLRDWYMSEFNPGTATSELEHQLGILQAGEQPSATTERRRYESFIATEPDSPLGFACLAQWFHKRGMPIEAFEVINEAEKLAASTADPFVIGIHVVLHFERGEFEDAQKQFQRWPNDDRGYEYWKTKGLICDQILHQEGEARDAYENALLTPGGQSDWLTRHRLAQVLMRMNLKEEAAAMRIRSTELEHQMEPQVHIPLREALTNLDSKQTHELMAEFYERIGRPRESRAWRDLAVDQTTPDSKASD